MSIHLKESARHRRVRLLNKRAISQALCSTGDGHQRTTTVRENVTCPRCLELMESFPRAEVV